MAKKEPLYPHVPKSRTKASSQVEVIETGDRDWYKPGIHLRNPSAEKIEDAKEEAINKGFDTVYVHRVAETEEGIAPLAEQGTKYYFCDNTRLHSNNEVIQVKTEEENPKCPYCGAVMTYGRYWGPLLATQL